MNWDITELSEVGGPDKNLIKLKSGPVLYNKSNEQLNIKEVDFIVNKKLPGKESAGIADRMEKGTKNETC